MKRIVALLGGWIVAFVVGCQIDEGPDPTGIIDVGAGSGGASGGATAGKADGAGMAGSDGGADAASGSVTMGGAGGATATGDAGGDNVTPDGGGSGGAPAPVDAGVGGAGPPSVCDGAGTRVLAAGNAKVDNFENATLNAAWSTFSDVAGAPNASKMIIQTGGAVGTAHSGHYKGAGAKTPAKGGYGVGAVFNLAVDRAHAVYCADVSAFDGISFWAKTNSAANNQLGVNFVVAETNAVSAGGDCPDASMKCYNHPRKTVTLTGNWAQYTVRFAEATGGSASVHGRIQELAFLSPDAAWDYAIDEIQFFKGSPPAGPAGP